MDDGALLSDRCLAYCSAMEQCDSPHQGLVTVIDSFGRKVGNSCDAMSIFCADGTACKFWLDTIEGSTE